MAATFRAASTGTLGATTSIPKPTGVQQFDVLLAVFFAPSGSTITPPSGWSLLFSKTSVGPYKLNVYTHTAGSSEPGTYSFTCTSTPYEATCVAYSSAATPTNFATNVATAFSTSFATPNVTTTAADTVVEIWAQPYTIATLPGAVNSRSNVQYVGIGDSTQGTAGSGGGHSASITTNNDFWVGATIDLPSGVGQPQITAPLTNATTTTLTPALSAVCSDNGATGTLKVTFQVATDAAFTNIVSTVSSATQNNPVTSSTFNATCGTLTPGTQYYVRAFGVDSVVGNGAFSAVVPFMSDHAPNAPTLINPGVQPATGATLQWTFSDPDTGDAQTSWALRISSNGGSTYQYWNAAGPGWSGTEVQNSGAAHSLLTPALAAGAWEFSVKTWDVAGVAGPYATDLSFQVDNLPTATVTSPTSGQIITAGGSVLGISWTYSQTQGVAQASYRVQLFDNAVQFYDTGVISGPATSASFDLVALGQSAHTDSDLLSVTVTVVSADGPTFTGSGSQSFKLRWGVPSVVDTSPTPGAIITTGSITAGWTFSDTRGNAQAAYRVRLWITGTGALSYDSGFIAGAAATYPIPFVLSDGTGYTLGVSVRNTNGIPSTETTDAFTVNLSNPANYPLEPRVGELYHCAINGVGLVRAEDPSSGDDSTKYKRVTLPLELTRFNTGNSNFAEAIEHYVYTAGYSWESGAGQIYWDRPNSDQDRFFDSDGVWPFDLNKLTLLNPTARTAQSTATVPRAVVANNVLYMAAGGTTLKYITSLGDNGTSLTAPANIVDLASDGTNWYAVCADGKIYKGTTTAWPGSAWSSAGSGLPASATANTVRWQAQRICVGYTNSSGNQVFSTLNSSGVEEVTNGRLVLPSGWSLGGIAGGGGFVWFGASSGIKGVIYKWDLSSNPPSQNLDLPIGVTPTRMLFYLGNLYVRGSYVQQDTHTGAFIYRCSVDTSGNLTPTTVAKIQQLGFDNGDGFWGAAGNEVYFGWTGMDGTNVGIGVIDATFGGYAKNLKTSQPVNAIVGAIESFLGAIVFTVGGSGLWVQQLNNYVTTGYLQTSIADKQSSLPKVYEQVAVVATNPLNTGESISVAYSIDGGSTFTSVTGAALSQAGQKYTLAALGVKSNSIAMKVTLGSNGLTTPVLELVSVRTRLTGVCDTELQLSIDCHDNVRGPNGDPLPENAVGAGARRARWLESLGQTRIQLQDIDWPYTNQADIYDVWQVSVDQDTVRERRAGKVTVGGIATLTLRKVAK